jgi:glycosyltransferase involved in cell wall biosynthesis
MQLETATAKIEHDIPTAIVTQTEHTTLQNCGRPLRVCHLAYTFYENDNRVIRYAEAADERGDHVDVISLRRNGQPRFGRLRGIQVWRIQRREVTEKGPGTYLAKLLWFFIKSTCLLTVLQLRRRYDVVHVHNVPDFLVFAAWFPRLMGSRVVLDIHDILPELYAGKFKSEPNSRVFRCLLMVERYSCRFADHVIVSNHLWHEKLVTRTVASGKCSTFLNYPDLRVFKPIPAEQKRRDGTFVILYPGTLNSHQGVDVAIRAFALVKDLMPRAEFHIYGEGPDRQQLIRLTKELGVTDRVRMMERRPLEEISVVMASANVGVVPKRAEGFGDEAFSTKVLEFMACAVPVIVSRTQVDTHYFDDTLVRFFASGAEDELADALLDVYQGRTDYSDSIRKAREFAVRYSWQERIGDYQSLIDSLVRTSVRS